MKRILNGKEVEATVTDYIEPDCERIWEVEGVGKVGEYAFDEVEEYHRCSVCGVPTEFLKGSTTAQWYLCDNCAGSLIAEQLGYTHDK